MANLHQKQIQIELVQERYYYDKIGKVDFLSAVPFMTREERNASYTGRELNSIPLALAEFTAESFRILG